MMWMASARDLVSIFVSLELVTITFYVLVAYLRRNVGSLEAGVKYLILGALSTGFLVYGIAWIYGMTGTTNLAAIALRLADTGNPVPLLPLMFGIALVLVALGFKVGAVPMQIWIPDVYQGAPSPTTAFLSVGSKAAGFVVLIAFLTPFLGSDLTRGAVLGILGLLAAATLLFGNLAAIQQSNFKRLLAYSSIAHAGFLLLALASGAVATSTSLAAAQVVGFYLATYLLMTLAAFFILNMVRIQRGAEDMAAFNGLGKTNPLLALALTLVMAALAGVPLTAGFVGKFFVFQLAVAAGLWWGVVIAFIGVAAGFYYYLKVVRAMYWNDPAAGLTPLATPPITRAVLALLCLAIIVFGVLPKPVLHAVNWAIPAATQLP
jgi:NADH-quinone oxidoreductase subunit N